MRQLNINITPEFERDLLEFMKRRHVSAKSEAVRLALREALSRESPGSDVDYRSWLGQALKAPVRLKPRFPPEDSLWS